MTHLRTLFLLVAVSFFSSYSSPIKQEQKKVIFEHEGVQYEKNNFGDIFPLWQEIPLENLSEKLSNFIVSLKNSVKNSPFIIVVPHNKALAIQAIKETNFFLLYHADNNKTEWIFKNGSSIPEPYTSTLGAQVFIVNEKDNTVLVIQEKTRSKFLGFPGGTSDFKELIRKTAVREVKEELDLDIDSNDLELFAIENSVKTNRFGANNVDYFFTISSDKVKGEINPDPQEIIRAFYAQLKDIAEGKSIEGLGGSEAQAMMAQHLLNNRSSSYVKTLLDFRQINKKESEQGKNDVMIFEFLKK